MIINTMVFAEKVSPLYDDFTPGKISSFTCSLIEGGEYYRAYVELLRLNSYYPSFLHQSVYDITSNYLFYKSRNYNDIIEFDFTKTADDVFIPVSLFRIDSLNKLNRHYEAKAELDKLQLRGDSKNYSDYLVKRDFYLEVLTNKRRDNSLNNKYPEFNELFEFSKSIYQSRKNPYIGAMAGVIPGMGYVYAGEKGTGIVSMIVIGAGSAVSYASYRNGVESLAAISGVITFFFYGGSIAGGYMQSVKYNDRLMDTLEVRLNRELMLERDLEEVYFKFGLNSNDCK